MDAIATWTPTAGGKSSWPEACRNLTCAGAKPLALTDCLNFGNPENPEVYFQLEWCIRGMAKACRTLGVPVVSGNVSLYNESRGQAIFPTPVVGGLGLLEDVKLHCRSDFPREGLVVAVLGQGNLRPRTSDLAGSEYLVRWQDKLAGRPHIDMDLEKRVQELCRLGIEEGIIASAHDCSEGGLAVALAEGSILGGVGFATEFKLPRRWDGALFGERQSRIVVTLPPEQWDRLQVLAGGRNTPLLRLGTTQRKPLPHSQFHRPPRGGVERCLGPRLGKSVGLMGIEVTGVEVPGEIFAVGRRGTAA